MTLLIFGGTGFIGSSLIKNRKSKEKIIFYSSKKVEIINFKKKTNTQFNSSIEYIKKLKKFDAIFCASTRYDPIKYKNRPDIVFKNNIKSIFNFIKILDKTKVNKLILLSSYAVYGNKLNKNLENSSILLKNFSTKEFYYASAKLFQENIINNFCKENKIKFNIIRLPSVYGPGSTLNKKNAHVIPSFILQLLKGTKKMNIYGTGKEIREFIYISDLIKIILKLRKTNYSGILNVGSNQYSSINELLNKIINIINLEVSVNFNNKSFSDVPIRKVSYIRFKKIIGNFKFTNDTTGLNNTINWYKKQLNV